jgi:hypothetical protein
MTYGTTAYGVEPYAGSPFAGGAGGVATPELAIELDAGTWTDITPDLVDVSTRRGRNRELGAYETGSLVATLRNDDRRYDPDHAAGPYYGKLRPNRRIRYRETWGGVTYPVILGYLDRLEQQYGGPNDAAAAVTASDLFKILNRVELPAGAYAAEITADRPAAWWRLDEPNTSTVARDNSGNGRDATYLDDPERGAEALATLDPSTSTRFEHTDPNRVEYAGRLVTGFPLTVEALIRITTQRDDFFRVIYQEEWETGTINAGHSLFVDSDALALPGRLFWEYYPTTSTTTSVYSTSRVDDGAVHHVAVVASSPSDVRLYVDGVDQTNVRVAGTTPMPTGNAFVVALGNGPALATDVGQFGLDGMLQDVAVYTAALSPARIAARNAAARTPWRGDLPGVRIARIADLAGVPAADREIDPGTTTLQSTDLGGDALSYAQTVEETELGRLFVARDGKLRFIGREAGRTGPYLATKATFVDADSGTGLPYRSVSADVDESILVTRATVSRAGGTAVTVTADPATVTEFQLLDYTAEGLLHDDDAYSRAYAEWIVNTRKTPQSRIGALRLDLRADPAALFPALLGLEIGDRVTYRRTPQNQGAVIDLAMRVESIAHEAGGGYRRAVLQLSPFNPGAAGAPVFTWDVTSWDNHVWGL